MAYATVSDIESRYSELTTEQESRASVLLDDAAVIINARLGTETPDQSLEPALKVVSCAMVNRALAAGAADAYGVSNATYTMGPFSQSATFSNPSGDLYLTSGELKLLGIGGSYLTNVRPVIGWTGV